MFGGGGRGECLEKRLGWQHRSRAPPAPGSQTPAIQRRARPGGRSSSRGILMGSWEGSRGVPPPSLQHRRRNKAAVLVGGWPPRAKGGGGWKFGGKKGCREGLAPSSSSPFPSHPLRPAGLNELRRMNYAEHRPLPATPRGSAWALSIHCPAAAAGRGGEKPRSQQRAGWELRPRRPRWVGGGGGGRARLNGCHAPNLILLAPQGPARRPQHVTLEHPRRRCAPRGWLAPALPPPPVAVTQEAPALRAGGSYFRCRPIWRLSEPKRRDAATISTTSTSGQLFKEGSIPAPKPCPSIASTRGRGVRAPDPPPPWFRGVAPTTVLTGGASRHLDDAFGLPAHLPGVEGPDAHRHLDGRSRHRASRRWCC